MKIKDKNIILAYNDNGTDMTSILCSQLAVDECDIKTPPVGLDQCFVIVDIGRNHVRLTNNRYDKAMIMKKISSYWR